MSVESEGNFLAHYGKKGMKWGQRKVSTLTPKSSKSKAETTRKVANRVLAASLIASVGGTALNAIATGGMKYGPARAGAQITGALLREYGKVTAVAAAATSAGASIAETRAKN